ncbi:HAMP domain-containing sensor histidine kinase [Flavobacterium sp.]|uniref:sensor histidine kinase n=1 Tax=Flavobacterium sp. TaxID=239 RepID=UPI002603CF77|nr:HAMP domain-containing sensor histidine kinase [Flavobacterium sp.]
MSTLSFKNRIAFYYIISTALIVAVVFIFIFKIVQWSVYSDVNADIQNEIKDHFKEMKLNAKNTVWIDQEEWREREHREINIDPVFVQITDLNGVSIEKSPNLNGHSLSLNKLEKEVFYTTKFQGQTIRQAQVPIAIKGKTKAYLLIAMSLEDATSVLNNLSRVLSILYPIVLLLLFVFARFIAGRSIRPINAIIETSNVISQENLKSRITLPQNKDELYTLSLTINNLLDRIESAIDREKQFTSDASHEFRTPLSVIKGTLEVLIRKPREKEEYENKINFCISEVDRLNNLVDQLLLLARFENQKQSVVIETISLNDIINETVNRFSDKIQMKEVTVIQSFSKEFQTATDAYFVSIIFSNLLSNALKYSNPKGTISILLTDENERIRCKIKDNGIGISTDDLDKIYNQFYRSEPSNHPDVKGTGLGLSIVKKLSTILQIDLQIESQVDKGTTVTLLF